MRRLKFAECIAAIGSLALVLILTVAPIGAQAQGLRKIAAVSAIASPTAVSPGGAGELVISVRIPQGFHVNCAKPTDPSLIPTTFAPSSSPGLKFGAAHYPKSVMVKPAGSTTAIPVYVGSVKITVPFKVARAAKAGKLAVAGTLTYQACNLLSCYPPVSDPVGASIAVK